MWPALLILALASSNVVDEDAVPGAGSRWLGSASSAYEELRFDEARIALDRALRDPSNSRTQLVEIYRLKGLVEASMGQPVAAKRAFAQMIVLQPDASLGDDYSPKITSAFEAARASLPGERGVLLESAAPTELRMGRDAELPVRLNDTLGMVEQIEVRYRVAGGEQQQVTLTRIDQGVLRIPAAQLPVRPEPYTLELEASAQTPFGTTLARLEAGAPATRVAVVTQLQEEIPRWYEQWWVWTGVAGGAVLLAGVTGGIVWALAPRDTSPRDIAVVVQ